MSQPNFLLTFPEVELSVEEIWPDGNAPKSPTAADVVAAMNGSVSMILREWNIEPDVIEVCGLHDHSKAVKS